MVEKNVDTPVTLASTLLPLFTVHFSRQIETALITVDVNSTSLLPFYRSTLCFSEFVQLVMCHEVKGFLPSFTKSTAEKAARGR